MTGCWPMPPPRSCADRPSRRNYAATSPVTRASGKRKVVAARYVHNGRLAGILHGCLKTRTRYDEDTAWGHRNQQAA